MKTIHIILTVIGTGLALVATVVGATWKISGDISRIETQVIQAREDITGLEAKMDEGFRQVGERFVQVDASILDLSTRVGRIEGRLIGRSGMGGSAPDDGLPPDE